ncbi:MAG: UbiD family decarboxylase domain-containing protein [Nitrospinota bacterium]
MSQDLRAFLKLLEERAPGELLRVSRPLKQEYEVTALVFELERRGESPAIIFEGLQGSAMPLLTNLYGSRKRLALALGVDEGELLEGWLKREELLTPPRILKEGPILEEVLLGEDADLFSLPILTHFEEDAGPYITAGVLVAKDPDTGTINGSFHRLQLKGARTLGVSLHSRRHLWNYQQRAEARGENLPVAVVLGSHPLFQLGAGLWKGDIGRMNTMWPGAFWESP